MSVSPDSLSNLLLTSLVSTALNPSAVKRGIELLLYNAETFLRVRRKKILAEKTTASEPANIPSNSASNAQQPADGSAPLASEPQFNSHLTEFWLHNAELEISSLFKQLDTHHRMLALKQEQIAKFGEFAPPYMKLAIEDEQRQICNNLQALSNLMQQIYDVPYPEIEHLSQVLGS